ncbi:MAG: ABC transporter permease, partial [Methanomicrobia archaeon]|nr:ABC transporter permease [Methanomicrobia archaeon]
MRDSLSLVFRNVKQRKARSALTILGITVGIGAVIALISIGMGMQAAITEQLIEMADVIMVTPGAQEFGSFGSFGSFTDRDLSSVRRIDGVKDVVGMRGEIEDVAYRDETFRLTVTGIDPADIVAVFGETIQREEEDGMAAGRDLRENDKQACEIGYSIA